MKINFILLIQAIYFVIIGQVNAEPDSIRIENKSEYPSKNKHDYQIFLKQPAKTIKLLMYEKDFMPIQGKLSDDRKSVIMKDYQNGTKVRIKVIYEDDTEDEFIKSPCYIDPVIL
jgi:hypothetical protein